MQLKYLRVILRKSKRNKLTIFITFLVASVMIFFNTDYSPDLYFLTWRPLENVSCYYSQANDVLPVVSDRFLPGLKSIFFHETSCKGYLNSRQACAVESAAKAHRNWQIIVFFTGPVSAKGLNVKSFSALKNYENIKFLRLHLVEYAKGTPLETMIKNGALNKTRWRISHTSDALRFLTLYKWGGVYLDLDMIVAKSFDSLVSNWAARLDDDFIESAVIAFSGDTVGRALAESAIKHFRDNFRGDVWGQNGPRLLTRILKNICSTKFYSGVPSNICKGFKVYGPEMFFPINFDNAMDYFDGKNLTFVKPYAYHLWNSITKAFRVHKKSIYAKLAQKNCPNIYKSYGDRFGT